MMNDDMFAGQWKQMRGTLKSWWGNLSDDDFEKIGGQKDKLIGVVQEKYGYSREQAQNEIDRRFNDYAGPAGGGWSGAGGAVIEDLKTKAYEYGASAANKAREATQTAQSYLKEKDLSTIAADVTGFMRKYPLQSVLIGAGLVFLLTRSSRRGITAPRRDLHEQS